MKTKTRVSSMAVESIQYDDQTKILTITMAYGPPKNHNEVLRYANVPLAVFNAFLSASSKGQFFNAVIRNDFHLMEK